MPNPSIEDITRRHNLYLETVKNSRRDVTEQLASDLRSGVSQALLDANVKTVGELSKTDLSKLTAELLVVVRDTITEWVNALVEFLRELLTIDFEIMREIYEVKFSMPLSRAFSEGIGEPMYGKLGTAKSLDKLFDEIMTEPMGSGLIPDDWLDAVKATSSQAVADKLRAAYARNGSLDELLRELRGSRNLGYLDGLIGRQARGLHGVERTLIHNISSTNQAAVGSTFVKKYRFAAVLDTRTSEQCRGYNGRVFVYGSGPIPPLHPHCRSEIVPITKLPEDKGEEPDSFKSWLATQPEIIRDDEFIVNYDELSLTLTEFYDKLSHMLATGD